MPDANVHVWTDLTAKGFDDATFSRDKIADFMLWRLEKLAQCCFERAIFLDYDVIVQQNLDHVFNIDFDVALTVRDPKDLTVSDEIRSRFPHNAGVMFARGREGQRFFHEVFDSYLKTSRDGWMDGQHALEIAFQKTCVRVIELPGRVYNYTPVSLDDDPSHAACVHYKGPRKSWIIGEAAIPIDEDANSRMIQFAARSRNNQQ